MKKILALLLTLMMLFSVATVFAGCDDSGSKKSSKSSKKDDSDEDEDEDEDEDDSGEDENENENKNENEDEDKTNPDEDEDKTDPDEDEDETEPDEDEDETEPEPTETEPEPTETEPEPTETDPEPTETEPEPTESVLDPDNYFYNEENTYYEENAINVRPLYVYWEEDGSLYAQCAVINGYAEALTNIEITYLYFANENGIIAEGSFGLLQDLVLEPYHYAVWTFRFEGNAVKAFGADLLTLEYSNEYSANYA